MKRSKDIKWISVKDFLPKEYLTKFLCYTYENGNSGKAVGFLDAGEWNIEWSDDHPLHGDITHWLQELGDN